MQKLLTSAFALLFTASLFAQHEPIQPFEELGIKVKVLTLSNGKYQESFPNDTTFRFGSVMFNRVTGEVVTVIEDDTLYGEYNLKAEVVSRWLSPDPLAAKYPNWSPYNFVADNPLIFIDPDGMDLIFAFKNKDTKSEDKANLQRQLNEGLGGYYTASIDKKGKVSLTAVEGKDFSGASDQVKGFYDVLNQSVSAEGKVEINVLNGDDNVVVGSFEDQAIDMKDLAAFENVTNTSGVPNAVSAQSKLAHEITEQHDKQINGNSDFPSAHGKAIQAENRVSGSTRGEDLRNVSNPQLEIRPTVFEVGGTRVIVTVTQDGYYNKTTVKQRKEKE
ncbi:MAG: hypothetical protein KIS77_11160 [Saprospiraceae bacterium]|nr:hypothetical protein [Saprospiraceae bacterium]